MHRLPDIVISPERKREITDSSAHLGSRQVLFYPRRSFYKIHTVIAVFVYSGSYSQNIRVKNNIVRIESGFIHQQAVSPFAHFDLTAERVGLSFFVERHHHDRSSETTDFPGAG